MTDTQTVSDTTPKAPALYGLDVPYDGKPIRVVAGEGLAAAIRVIKGAGPDGITASKLAETLNILGASADNYTRKLGLLGLVSKRPLPHTGKGAAAMTYAWIAGREIDLISQEDSWNASIQASVTKRLEARKAKAAERRAASAAKLEFNRTQGETVKALKAEAAAKVKAAREAAQAEVKARIAALQAATVAPTPEPTQAATVAPTPEPEAPKANGTKGKAAPLPPKGKK